MNGAFKQRHGKHWKEEFEKFKKYRSKLNTLAGHIDYYGDVLGKLKYKELNDKKSISLSKVVFINKLIDNGANETEIKSAINARWSHTCEAGFIRNHGNRLGKIKYIDYIKKSKASNPICLEYYIAKGIPENEAYKIIQDIQISRNSRISTCSKESLDTLLPIINVIDIHTNDKTIYGENEYTIKLSKYEQDLCGKSFFKYDFYNNDLNLIIEYHGKRYHEDVNYDSTKNLNMEYFREHYNYDLFKKYIAESRNHDILIIRSWELKSDLLTLFKYLQTTIGLDDTWKHLFF